MSPSQSLWETKEHQAFAESLNKPQREALLDLLLLASLSDEMLTNAERVDLAVALRDVPGLKVLDFDTASLVDHIDELYARHQSEAGLLVADLLEPFEEDESSHLHILKVVIRVMRSHGLVHDEARFARTVGSLMQIHHDRVNALIAEARGEDEEK